VAEAERLLLAGEAGLAGGGQILLQLAESLGLAARFERVLELVLAVEMILDDGLVAAGDEDKVLDAGLARLVDRILDQRAVDDRQHFLRHCLGGGQEACAEPGHGKYRGPQPFRHSQSLPLGVILSQPLLSSIQAVNFLDGSATYGRVGYRRVRGTSAAIWCSGCATRARTSWCSTTSVTGFDWAVDQRARLVEGNAGDMDLVGRLIAEHGISEIIHFAGSIVVPESVSNPLKYYANNTAASRNLIEAAVKGGVKHMVFSSTAAVYGMPGWSRWARTMCSTRCRPMAAAS
jgi:hypothetical protein